VPCQARTGVGKHESRKVMNMLWFLPLLLFFLTLGLSALVMQWLVKVAKNGR
jgi:hypothetical protein